MKRVWLGLLVFLCTISVASVALAKVSVRCYPPGFC